MTEPEGNSTRRLWRDGRRVIVTVLCWTALFAGVNELRALFGVAQSSFGESVLVVAGIGVCVFLWDGVRSRLP